MAKFFGVIGYQTTNETEPGLFEELIVEHEYYGDVLRNNRRLQDSNTINPNVTTSNQISIVSDPFAVDNIYNMRYVTYTNSKWTITNVDVQYPRLILSIGGIYNG